MKKLLFLLLSLLAFAALAVTEPKEAYQKVKEGKAVIVDVREAHEIKSGMIDQAIWFPTSGFAEDSKWKEEFLRATKGKEVFLYCRSGNRSGKIEKLLEKNGIEAENLGGYENLKEELPTKVP